MSEIIFTSEQPTAARAGDYGRHECGLEVVLAPHHRGVWVCEMERYHAGFSRRYGEIRCGHWLLV